MGGNLGSRAHLENEKAVVVKIYAFAFEQPGDFCEVASLIINVVVRAVVAVCSAGHGKLCVWNRLKGLLSLQVYATAKLLLVECCASEL